MILSSSLLTFDAQDGFVSWSKELQKVTDVKFRRTSRFSQAVLCGALSCVQKVDKKDFAVYFGTANGDVDSTINSQDNIFLKNYFPPPFSFINTLSSTPLFFLSQHLKLNTFSISLGHSCFAFESALSLALADLNFNRTKCALVGVSDVRHESPSVCGFADKRLHEFSAWLLINKDDRNFVKFFDDFDDVLENIRGFDSKTKFYFSNVFNANEIDILSKYAKLEAPSVPQTIANYSSSVICSHFLDKFYPLFYVGKNPKGGYSLVSLYR